MRTYIIIALLIISVAFTAYSSARLIDSTVSQYQGQGTQSYPFSFNYTEVLYVPHSGDYAVKIESNKSIFSSLYVIALISLGEDSKTVAVTLSSPYQVVHLHRGLYQVKFFVTGTSRDKINITTLEQNVNLTIIYEGEGED
ncbi:hypothetical protein GWK48_08755 [Metallosphaera tengchongensis]|uniref:Uncharacterized protein n=1 Tax=Metallosphaera tengchongensis TaxID=1532350 RepID=A0A6N0NZE5_9CREN|nr:hypothetical protein [Metallosphaera tengchongensis]QKR00450.1 hypothetical protein GWK48_08755 [Metallosphaera tengchongensis]